MMNKSNIQTNKNKRAVFAMISIMVAFALVASPLLSTLDNAYAQSTYHILASDSRSTNVDVTHECTDTNEDHNAQVCTPDEIAWCYNHDDQVCEVVPETKGIGNSKKTIMSAR